MMKVKTVECVFIKLNKEKQQTIKKSKMNIEYTCLSSYYYII